MTTPNDAAFDAAKHVLCCIHKQDIPEVEAVIRLLRPSLEDHWRWIVSQILQEAEAQLDQFDTTMGTPSIDAIARAPQRDREKLTDDILLAILGALYRRSMAPLPPAGGGAIVRRSIASLLADGAKAAGERLDLAQAPLLTQAAYDDLLTLMRGRLTLRRSEISALLRAFLTSAAPRTPAPTDLTLAALRATGGKIQTIQDWRAALATELGIDTNAWLPFTIDQWAYRWFNIGSFTAARQGGVLAFRIDAVRDFRTSAFCLWVNGRVVSAEKIQRQVDRHVEAALAGDLQAMMANWPLLTFTAGMGAPEFEIMFERVGLPPYHGRCRSRAVPVRLV